MKNAIIILLTFISINIFAQDCNPEFSYDKSKYCSNEGEIIPNHDNGGMDGIYTYSTLLGAGTLALDSLNGRIDLSNSETGIYEVNNLVATAMCTLDTNRQIEVINDNTPPVIELDDFNITTNPWNCLGDFAMPNPVITDESESQILFTLEGPEDITLLPPNTETNASDNYVIAGAPVGEYIFTFSATDPCGNESQKEVIVTVMSSVLNAVSNLTIPIELYYTTNVAKVNANEITDAFDGCQLIKFELRRDSDACNIEGNDTYNDDGHDGDGSSDMTDSNYDPDDGAYISVCLADIDDIDSNGEEFGLVPILIRVWRDDNNTGIFGDFIDKNGDGDVIDFGEFDHFSEGWNNVEVRKHSLFNTVICPPDITVQCNTDYTSPSLENQIIVPDTLNNGEYNVSYTPNLNSCNQGTVTATYTIEDIIYCNRTITVVNEFPSFEFDPSLIPDITISCEDTIPGLPPIISGACDFLGFISDLDTIATDSMNGLYTIENNYTLIDWCIYDSTDGSEGLYVGTQDINVVDIINPSLICFSLSSLNTKDFPTAVTASEFVIGGFDICTGNEKLRYTFTDVPPSLDPDFDESINSSTMTFTHGNAIGNPLMLNVYIWDLANNFDFCIVSLSFNPLNNSIQCPEDITLNCDQDYTDINLTGSPIIPDSLNLVNSLASYTPLLDACGIGSVLVTHSSGDSVICTQTVTIENPFPAFDPSSIIMPNDTTVTDCSSFELQPPTWVGGPCDFIGYTEDVDTFTSMIIGEFTIQRDFTVINWCLYDATNGANGIYFGNQEITIQDTIPPTPYCLSIAEYSIDNLPITITAKSIDLGAIDNCTENKDLRFTFSDTPPELDPDFDSSINSSTRILTAAEFAIGTFFIDVYHWDFAGNSSFCTTTLGILTGTEDIEKGIIQSINNYPNPFSESTTIEFNLQKNSDIKITVYDINGKEYISVSEYLTAGENRKNIDLSDATSGMLFLKMQTNNSVAVKKMIKM